MTVWAPKFGDRVEYSAHGLEYLRPRSGPRRGTIAGGGRAYPISLYVKWDGTNSVSLYHCSFLKPATEAGPIESVTRLSIMAGLCGLGLPAKQIAAQMKMSPNGVRAALKRLGLVPTRERSGRRAGRPQANPPKAEPCPKKMWTAGGCARLTSLWNAGWTCGEIATAMQRPRNAVIGKAHRLGLPPRRSPIKYTSRKREKARRVQSVPQPTSIRS